MAKRDDFSPKVKDTLAKRVGYQCSNPNCDHETVGPHSDRNKSLSTGVAAHITAAAPDGPRYDRNLSVEQRKSIDNGIWLCEYCAKLIDKDEAIYPVLLLVNWKINAEAKMFQLQNFEIKKTNDEGDSKLKESIKVINSCVSKIYDCYEYFYKYYKSNFSHFQNHSEAMYSLGRHFELHESSLSGIIELNKYRSDLIVELSKIELDLNNNLYDLIKRFDSLGDFTYQTDHIGLYNNYYEEFFSAVIKNRKQRTAIKDQIIREIRTYYSNLK